MNTRNSLVFCLVMTICCIYASRFAQAAVVTFQQGDGGSFSDTDATYLEERAPTTNYGTDGVVKLEEEYRTSTHLLFTGLIGYFDILGDSAGQIPSGSTINSATLSLKVADDGRGNAELHQMLTSWDEDTIAWDALGNASPNPFNPTTGDPLNDGGGTPGVDYYAAVVASQILDTDESTYDFDIASALQGWVDGTSNNYGFYIIQQNSNHAQIYSDDAANLADRPLLTVDFTPPVPAAVPEPSALLLATFGLIGIVIFGRRRKR